MQPFEIIKVRLQTQSSINPEYSGILDCLKKTVKQEGFMALYKGTVSPLIGVGFQVSVQFALNEVSKRFFSQFKKRAEDLLPLHLVAASGFIAGFGSGLVAVFILLDLDSNLTRKN
jgi:solute carrier family 25 carnitine/acylcarnitine transporter 20/29